MIDGMADGDEWLLAVNTVSSGAFAALCEGSDFVAAVSICAWFREIEFAEMESIAFFPKISVIYYVTAPLRKL